MRSDFLQIKQLIRRYFDFSKTETNGFMVLMILMIAVLFVPLIIERYYPEDESNAANDKRILDSITTLFETGKTPEILPEQPAFTVEKKVSLFNFNPNTISAEEMEQLGLRDYVADRILKYRHKGGVFKIKTDMKKIYGLPETQYKILEPYIQLPVSQERAGPTAVAYPKSFIKKIALPLDMNAADSSALEKIYGVGYKLASRIIKYRTRLGGFISMQQLKEVYGLDSSVLAEINKKFEINKEFVPLKININSAEYDILKTHPYIGYKFAKIIVSFRNQHGNYHSADQLKEIKIMTDEDIEKIRPYLAF